MATNKDEVPEDIAAKCALVHLNYFSNRPYKIEPYFVVDDWKIRAVHRFTGEVLIDNIPPDNASAKAIESMLEALVLKRARAASPDMATAMQRYYLHVAGGYSNPALTAAANSQAGVHGKDLVVEYTNPLVKDLDPYSPNLTEEERKLIIAECKANPLYFFRTLVLKEKGTK